MMYIKIDENGDPIEYPLIWDLFEIFTPTSPL